MMLNDYNEQSVFKMKVKTKIKKHNKPVLLCNHF